LGESSISERGERDRGERGSGHSPHPPATASNRMRESASIGSNNSSCGSTTDAKARVITEENKNGVRLRVRFANAANKDCSNTISGGVGGGGSSGGGTACANGACYSASASANGGLSNSASVLGLLSKFQDKPYGHALAAPPANQLSTSCPQPRFEVDNYVNETIEKEYGF
jgi:hypothetical protein